MKDATELEQIHGEDSMAILREALEQVNNIVDPWGYDEEKERMDSHLLHRVEEMLELFLNIARGRDSLDDVSELQLEDLIQQVSKLRRQ